MRVPIVLVVSLLLFAASCTTPFKDSQDSDESAGLYCSEVARFAEVDLDLGTARGQVQDPLGVEWRYRAGSLRIDTWLDRTLSDADLDTMFAASRLLEKVDTIYGIGQYDPDTISAATELVRMTRSRCGEGFFSSDGFICTLITERCEE